MKITICSVGKVKRGPYATLADEYHGRIAHYRPLALETVRQSTASDADARRTEESDALLNAAPAGAVLIVMDERGESWTSEQLAAWFSARMLDGTRHVALCIGGPDGHSDALRRRADVVLNLSTFTLPHDLARVVLAEQLYRAFTIVRGEPYHR